MDGASLSPRSLPRCITVENYKASKERTIVFPLRTSTMLYKNGPVSAWFTPLISAFMFSFLAWPRAILISLVLTTLAQAREESLCESTPCLR